ncbi:MAG: hypothetical protein ACREBC_20000, partial [Pyrinomonadaceae bacterium]
STVAFTGSVSSHGLRNLHEEDHHAGDPSTVVATLDSGSHINVIAQRAAERRSLKRFVGRHIERSLSYLAH